jgi:hypothetical protein
VEHVKQREPMAKAVITRIRILVVAMTNAHVANVEKSRAMERSAHPMTIVHPINAGAIALGLVVQIGAGVAMGHVNEES